MQTDEIMAVEAIAEAWSLMARREWPAALQHWRHIMERFPDNPSGYAGAGAAYRESGRLDEAEELLTRAFLRFPNSSEVATNRGWTANARRDWTEAVRRWEQVRVHHPESPSGYAGGGAALRELGRFDEAEAVLSAGLKRLPDSPDIAVTYASVANTRCDWAAAVERWTEVKSRFANSPSAYLGGAAALRALDRLDAADSLLAEGFAQCPGRSDIGVEYARSAERRDDWQEAARRWELVRRRFPDDAAARSGAEAARQKLPDPGEMDARIRSARNTAKFTQSRLPRPAAVARPPAITRV